MTVIDPSSDLGKLRLRCGDWQTLPWLPDTVYLQTLTDSGGNLPAAAKTCALYILAMLSFRTHEKMAQLESWSAESYTNFKDFLLTTVSNPAFMSFSPIPSSTSEEFSPILSFQKAWNQNFNSGDEAQQLAFTGDISANDGSRLGMYGRTGWSEA
jgi:hypothetical protein